MGLGSGDRRALNPAGFPGGSPYSYDSCHNTRVMSIPPPKKSVYLSIYRIYVIFIILFHNFIVDILLCFHSSEGRVMIVERAFDPFGY